MSRAPPLRFWSGPRLTFYPRLSIIGGVVIDKSGVFTDPDESIQLSLVLLALVAGFQIMSIFLSMERNINTVAGTQSSAVLRRQTNIHPPRHTALQRSINTEPRFLQILHSPKTPTYRPQSGGPFKSTRKTSSHMMMNKPSGTAVIQTKYTHVSLRRTHKNPRKAPEASRNIRPYYSEAPTTYTMTTTTTTTATTEKNPCLACTAVRAKLKPGKAPC